MPDLIIKSSLRNYEVNFTDSVIESLKKELKTDDVILIDNKVHEHLNENVCDLLEGYKHLLIDANEDQKSYTALPPIIEKLMEFRFRKNHRLIAIGGGITQDITAFIASIMYRGVEWLFFPTTLLAQADSCIGGKTSINLGKFKNQLGNFYPPSKIFIIPEFTKSLPPLDFKSGMGEMLHFYLVSGEDDFNYYTKHYEKAFTDPDVLKSLIRKNLGIKQSIIERDEFDIGERQLLNYGHSFGHAIETLTDYAIPHGIAVSYGMDISNFISVKLGFIDESLRMKIRDALEKNWEGTHLPLLDVNEYENALSHDKKNIGNTYQVILTKGVGKMLKHGIEPNPQFSGWLEEYFNTQVVG